MLHPKDIACGRSRSLQRRVPAFEDDSRLIDVREDGAHHAPLVARLPKADAEERHETRGYLR